jgi:hypothetical protein
MIHDEIDKKAEAVAARITAGLLARYGEKGRVLRDAHPRCHAILAAQLDILPPDTTPGSDPALHHGLFGVPRRQKAWVRFSSSNGDAARSDELPDARGMAIKVLGVPGDKLLQDERETHDFVMINYPLFPFATADEYLAFMSGPAHFRESHPEVAALFATIEGQEVGSLLDVTWHSTTPYRLGPDRLVRYVLQPDFPRSPDPPATGSDRYRLDLVHRLGPSGQAPATFTLYVHPKPDAVAPDDPRVPWPVLGAGGAARPEATRWQPVARLTIPCQDFDNPRRRDFGEALSFSPWHARVEHEPFGEINQMRRVVYLAVAKLRAERGGASCVEPASDGSESFAPGSP